MVIPLGCLLTPLKEWASVPLLTYEPIRCKTCAAILNPFCEVDYRSKLWVCPFCTARNTFPQHYADISENNLPAELYSQYTTVEYKLGAVAPQFQGQQPMRTLAPPPIFVYVVDVCLPTEGETEALKDALTMSFNLLPENAQVCPDLQQVPEANSRSRAFMRSEFHVYVEDCLAQPPANPNPLCPVSHAPCPSATAWRPLYPRLAAMILCVPMLPLLPLPCASVAGRFHYVWDDGAAARDRQRGLLKNVGLPRYQGGHDAATGGVPLAWQAAQPAAPAAGPARDGARPPGRAPLHRHPQRNRVHTDVSRR